MDNEEEFPKTPWVVMQDNLFKCLRCGESYTPTLPCSIPMFTGMVRLFAAEHENCEEKA